LAVLSRGRRAVIRLPHLQGPSGVLRRPLVQLAVHHRCLGQTLCNGDGLGLVATGGACPGVLVRRPRTRAVCGVRRHHLAVSCQRRRTEPLHGPSICLLQAQPVHRPHGTVGRRAHHDIQRLAPLHGLKRADHLAPHVRASGAARPKLADLRPVPTPGAQLEAHIALLQWDGPPVLLEAEVLELAHGLVIRRAEDEEHVMCTCDVRGDLPYGLRVDLDASAPRPVGGRQTHLAHQRPIGAVEVHLHRPRGLLVIAVDHSEATVALAQRYLVEPRPGPILDAVHEGPLPPDALLQTVVVAHLEHQWIGDPLVPRGRPAGAVGVELLIATGKAHHHRLPALVEVHIAQREPVAIVQIGHPGGSHLDTRGALSGVLCLDALRDQWRPRRHGRRVGVVVPEAEGFLAREVGRRQLGACAGEVGVEEVIPLVHIHTHGVVPQPTL